MNNKYRLTLGESKKLNGSGLLQKASAYNITADKILYDHAIQMVIYKIAISVFTLVLTIHSRPSLFPINCFIKSLQCQSAALDELFGNPEDCFNRYQSAQILLHSLASTVR